MDRRLRTLLPTARGTDLLWAILVLGMLAALTLAVAAGQTTAVDIAIRQAVHSLASRVLTRAMWLVSQCGSVAGTCVVTIGAAAYYRKKGNRRGALRLLTTVCGAFLGNVLFKTLVHRPRPEPFFGLTAPASFSYPSGHALLAVTLYGSLALDMVRHCSGRMVRLAAPAAAALLCAAIGFSRIYLGLHYPSDIVGGFLTGVLWLWASRNWGLAGPL